MSLNNHLFLISQNIIADLKRLNCETLRREIKADVRNQHDLYLNNLIGDVKTNSRDFYRYINSQKKTPKVFLP